MARLKRVFTLDNVAKIKELAAKGYQHNQVAEILGISPFAVSRLTCRYDIDFKRPVNKCDVKTDWGLLKVVNDIFNTKPITKNKNRMAAY